MGENVLQLIDRLNLQIDWLFEDGEGKEKNNNKWISKALLRYVSSSTKAQFFRKLTTITNNGGENNNKHVFSNNNKRGEEKENSKEDRLLRKLNFLESVQFKKGVIDLLSLDDDAEARYPFPISSKYSQKLVLSKAQLQSYEVSCREKWNLIYRFLLKGENETFEEFSSSSAAATRGKKRVKISGGLSPLCEKIVKAMDLVDGDNVITKNGYEFLLKDLYEQVWMFLAQVLRTLATNGERCMVLRFLLKINLLQSSESDFFTMSEDESRFCSLLFETGLLYSPNNVDDFSCFRASNLGKLCLSSPWCVSFDPIGTSLASKSNFEGLEIIVETTFNVYAYTSDEMHVWLLKLFVQVEKQLPNLVVGLITRESVGEALKKGISSQRILHFLTQNAHKHCVEKRRFNIVPENVYAQIYMWEKERVRTKITPGSLFKFFGYSDEEFKSICDWAHKGDMVEWMDAEKKWVFIRKEMKAAFQSHAKAGQ